MTPAMASEPILKRGGFARRTGALAIHLAWLRLDQASRPVLNWIEFGTGRSFAEQITRVAFTFRI
jgi:hypothetical protein